MIKRLTTLVFIVAAIILLISLATFDRIMVHAFAVTHGLDIKYASICRGPGISVIMKKMTAVDVKRNFGISSDLAEVKASWGRGLFKSPDINVDLKDVGFVKGPDSGKERYDTVDGLLAMPFSKDYRYSLVSCRLTPINNGTHIESFKAESELIRLTFKGDIFDNNDIKGDIVIYFADKVLAKIPNELTSVLLKNEPDSWKSLSVSLSGNYASPSIKVTGRLFRLNIGTK